jgi:hypothetical protein
MSQRDSVKAWRDRIRFTQRWTHANIGGYAAWWTGYLEGATDDAFGGAGEGILEFESFIVMKACQALEEWNRGWSDPQMRDRLFREVVAWSEMGEAYPFAPVLG